MNKYNNRRTSCISGHMHDSAFEAAYCDKLLFRMRAGEIKSYLIQKPYDMVVNKTVICRHIVDFLVIYPDLTAEVHEAKGVRTATWSIKRKLFMALWPHIKYVVISKGVVPWMKRKKSKLPKAVLAQYQPRSKKR